VPWWGWIIVGAVLLGAELFLVPTDFFLALIGVSAAVVGLVGVLGGTLPAEAQWALFGALSLASLVFVRRWLKERLRPGEPPRRVDDTLVGEVGCASEDLGPGQVGRVELRGVPWSARNLETTPLEAGARVRVERVEGLVLGVRRAA
jgi:membrane protein implicated in regulation of membrane protease activity